jgi:hypothetical protein
MHLEVALLNVRPGLALPWRILSGRLQKKPHGIAKSKSCPLPVVSAMV